MRIRLERALTERIAETQRRAASERKETRVALDAVNSEVTNVTREIVQELDAAVAEVRMELHGSTWRGWKIAQSLKTSGHRTQAQRSSRSKLGSTDIDNRSSVPFTGRDEDGRFIGMNLMNESIQEDLIEMRERSRRRI
ncbi:MAG: hypothetical protein R2762_15520 [Bryobacteraceae bacterium]